MMVPMTLACACSERVEGGVAPSVLCTSPPEYFRQDDSHRSEI